MSSEIPTIGDRVVHRLSGEIMTILRGNKIVTCELEAPRKEKSLEGYDVEVTKAVCSIENLIKI